MRAASGAALIIQNVVCLPRHAFNGYRAELRVFIANFTSLLIIGSIAPGFRLFEAVPHLNSNAGGWRRSLKRRPWSASDEFTARSFDTRLSDRSKFLEVGIEIGYLNFAYCINRRFGLSLKTVDRGGAEGGTCKH